MAQKIRIEVDKELWDETPWLFVGPLIHGAFSFVEGGVRSPYHDLPAFHFQWDKGWTLAAQGKIKVEVVKDEEPGEPQKE
jgi:hypothetical protein